jgi:hypothetical protein
MGVLKGRAAAAVFQQAKGLRTKLRRENRIWSRSRRATAAGMDEEKMGRHVKCQKDAGRLDEGRELRDCPF